MSRYVTPALMFAVAVATGVGIDASAEAQSRRASSARASVAAEIAALDGAMPTGFDIYPADPCAGLWQAQRVGGRGTFMTVLVMRYRNVPLAHLSRPGMGSVNEPVIRLDPHSVRIVSGSTTLTFRCTTAGAIAQIGSTRDGRTVTVRMVPGETAAPAATPNRPRTTAASVRVVRGNIQYVDGNGGIHQLTQGGGYDDPVLSPDGGTVAFVHVDRMSVDGDGEGRTSLWLADVASGQVRRLLAARPDREPKRNLATFGQPRFSLDGGFVYIDADAWVTSPAVHQVNVRTGAERFVTDGATLGIIRNGPYRGYLLVSQHRYREPAGTGSYDPVSVVRPDGVAALMVPDTDGDGDTQTLVTRWLDRNGWQAN